MTFDKSYIDDIKRVVDIFDQIKSTTSRNDKESLLRVNETDILFTSMLKFLLDPFVLTGLKTKKMMKFANYKHEESFFREDIPHFANIQEAMDYIKENNTGRDVDAKAIMNFINSHDMETFGARPHDFLQEFFNKELKLGLTAKTVNKVYGKGFIDEFGCMLAYKYEDKADKLTGDFYITLKIDGNRCIAIKEDGNVKFFTRQGKLIDGLHEITSEFENLPDNMVYDGELLLDLDLPSDKLFRATQKVVRKDGEKENLVFHIFDMLPIEEFKNGKSKLTYDKRRQQLDDLSLNLSAQWIDIVLTLYVGDDHDKIIEWSQYASDRSLEGIMINSAKGYYVTKRSSNLLKVKKMESVDLRVVDIEEGTGKYVGKLGAIIVEYKEEFTVRVGSGFSDLQRKLYWDNPEEILMKIVEIQYFEESENKRGLKSLRFPIFKGIRDDKDEPSYH